MNTPVRELRFDLKIIASWIEPGSKVLDLGCGEGDLLEYLKIRKNVRGTGIEKDEAEAGRCIEKGLSVIHGDINTEIEDYPEHAFDYVILSQTLQQVFEPSELLRSLLRVGRKGIVSFPNFSHWAVRFQLFLKGYAPVTPQLPYEWYDTPNIRVITIRDFKNYSEKMGFEVLKEAAINTHGYDKHGTVVRHFPNLFATYGIFMIGKR